MNGNEGAPGARAGLPDVVPLFPLPDHVLLPATPAPYHVFEPRYRALVEHLLAGEEGRRWLAVPRLAPGWQSDYEGRPAVLEIATVARLARCERNPDGTFEVVVDEGVRCRLREVSSSHPFRLASVEPWPDLPGADEAALRGSFDALLQVVAALAQALGPSARGLAALAREKGPLPRRLFRLGSVLVQHPDRRHEFLVERDPVRRVDQLLDAAATLLGLASAQGGGKSIPS